MRCGPGPAQALHPRGNVDLSGISILAVSSAVGSYSSLEVPGKVRCRLSKCLRAPAWETTPFLRKHAESGAGTYHPDTTCVTVRMADSKLFLA